jgi:hypothetical protein
MYAHTIRTLDRLRADALSDGDCGAWDGYNAGAAFTMGGCALLAASLAVRHGLPVVSVDEVVGDEPDERWPVHFYVRTADGWLVDVYGDHDVTGILNERNGGDNEWIALREWDDYSLACLLETWHDGVPEDYDLVLTADDFAASSPLSLIRTGGLAERIL